MNVVVVLVVMKWHIGVAFIVGLAKEAVMYLLMRCVIVNMWRAAYDTDQYHESCIVNATIVVFNNR